MIYLRSFKLSEYTDRNPNIYPDHVFKHLAGEVLYLIELLCCMAITAAENQLYSMSLPTS
ncbi:hypothetical protein SAMN06295960_1268 [Paenibacillus aquistagni]|uniref:Uncharacterized protein n=1 Tax=Paenibacillus aquistagni TaxID=1852522 RepID=A0A1X7J5U4_9BACL|nr:hypothetical protein SAMN06295960_1268 [Paenibacillus aquistagni]